MRDEFARWASGAEFSDDLPFSKVLSLIVDTKFIGGDMVAELPERAHHYMRIWFVLGWLAFVAFIAIFWLMVAKPL